MTVKKLDCAKRNDFKYEVIIRKTTNGKTTKRSKKFYTKKEAEQWEREMLTFYNANGLFPDQVKKKKEKTLQNVYDEWYKTRINQISNRTINFYNAGWNAIDERIKKSRINEINIGDLEECFYSVKYYNQQNIKNILNQVCKFAIRRQYTTINYADYLEPARNTKPKPKQLGDEKYISMEYYFEIIDQLEDKNSINAHKASLVMSFSRLAGLRAGEALALTYDDIDMNNNIIHVTKQLEITTWKIKAPKYGSSRNVPLNPLLKEIILKESEDAESNIIISDLDNYTYYGTLKYQLVSVRKNLNDEFLHFHQGRHSFGSDLISQGVPATDVQKILGHKDLTTTLNTYTHAVDNLTNDRVMNAYSKLYSNCTFKKTS